MTLRRGYASNAAGSPHFAKPAAAMTKESPSHTHHQSIDLDSSTSDRVGPYVLRLFGLAQDATSFEDEFWRRDDVIPCRHKLHD